MTDPNVLRVAVAVLRAQTQPELSRLLKSLVPEEDMRPFRNPGLQGFGTLADALDRVGWDLTASGDDVYAGAVFLAAQTKIAAAQQGIISAVLEENAELRERVDVLERSSLEASATK
jgi:hypothetical protein